MDLLAIGSSASWGGNQTTRTTANSIDASLSSLGTDIEASTGSVYHFYIRDAGGNLLAIVSDSAGSFTTRYPILDGISSVIGLTNGSGGVSDTWKYDPYGIVLSHTGSDYNPFGYTSAYTDASTGLIHLGARYDNPADGRFTQQDPSGQETNLYSYAGDDPVNNIDPSGRSIWSVLDTIDKWAETVAVPIALGIGVIQIGASLGGAAALGLGLVAGVPLIAAGITVGVIWIVTS